MRYLGSSQYLEQDGQKHAKNRQDLVFCQIRFDELREHLHGTMNRVGRVGRQKGDQR
jgi:hypothetical protein